ncbi:MAG: type VI secretion system tube protein Hcp [Gemmatimonadota bacterium]|nr:type VI secretion system tube protein Hcp [Gemmatimonadota bacterium]
MPTPMRHASLLSMLLLVAPLTAAKAPVTTPESKLRSLMFASEFYVTIEGTKQGKFKGESVRDREKDKIAGLAFQYEVTSPRDLASGMASGKRQHKPIVFTKEWGAASPQLFQALTTNEVLKSVLFEFSRTNANGEEYVFQTIKLTNATVSAIKQYSAGATAEGAAASKRSADAGRQLEDVSMTFQKIEMENRDGKTAAVDDWMIVR